jgi:hypothetical protein
MVLLQDSTVSDVAYSKEAMGVLNKIKRALEEGKQALVVQTTPHIVVLSRSFYDVRLKPLLMRWALLWLHAHGCNALGANEILEYLGAS